MPQVGDDVDAAGLYFRRLGILVLVNHVLVKAVVHEAVHLVLGVGLAEGGQILAGIAVQHQLVLDETIHGLRIRLPVRNPALAQGPSRSGLVEQVVVDRWGMKGM